LGKIIFGDAGQAALSFLSVPLWFWEGEAVNTETEFSSGGRGRLPSFSMGTRSILLAGKQYKYIKSYLSSYKDHIPNVYELGYFLTAWLRKNHSEDTVEKVLSRASRASFYPFIFSHSLKKETGLSVRELYRRVMDDLYEKWSPVDHRLNLTPFRETLNRRPIVWTLYTSPRFDSKGNILALRYGLDSPLTLVSISPGGDEKKIISLNTMGHIHTVFSTGTGKTVWAESRRDIRWGKRSYSELMILDLKSKNKTRLTRKSRLFSPAITGDGKLIAAIRFSRERKTSLCILSASDGELISTVPSPENSFLMTPSWDEQGQRMVMIRMKGGRKAVTLFNRKTGRFRDILPLAHISYSSPVFYKDYILLGSPGTGIDNIHAVDISTGKEYVITTSRFGAFYPSVSADGNTLLYSEYGIQGMRPVTAALKTEEWTLFHTTVDNRAEYFRKGEEFPEVKDLTDLTPDQIKKFPVKRYSRWKDLIHFHSRVLVPDRTNPAVEFYSSNLLNTTFLTAGIRYNTNEEQVKVYTEAVYAGLFPVIKAGFSRGGRRIKTPADLSWKESETWLSLQLPMDLSRGEYITNLTLGTDVSSTSVSGSNESEGYKISPGKINSLSYELRYLNYKHSSKRDLAPLSGQIFSLSYSHTPWDTRYRGEKLTLSGTLFFRGIFKHHSLRAGFSYEKQIPDTYIFSSRINFPRGYDSFFRETLLFLSADYSFPIAYPDLELGELLYLKRIKGTLFYDWGKGYGGGATGYFNSAGIEIRGDLNVFSIPLDLDIGMRISYRFLDKSIRVEPIALGISF